VEVGQWICFEEYTIKNSSEDVGTINHGTAASMQEDEKQ